MADRKKTKTVRKPATGAGGGRGGGGGGSRTITAPGSGGRRGLPSGSGGTTGRAPATTRGPVKGPTVNADKRIKGPSSPRRIEDAASRARDVTPNRNAPARRSGSSAGRRNNRGVSRPSSRAFPTGTARVVRGLGRILGLAGMLIPDRLGDGTRPNHGRDMAPHPGPVGGRDKKPSTPRTPSRPTSRSAPSAPATVAAPSRTTNATRNAPARPPAPTRTATKSSPQPAKRPSKTPTSPDRRKNPGPRQQSSLSDAEVLNRLSARGVKSGKTAQTNRMIYRTPMAKLRKIEKNTR